MKIQYLVTTVLLCCMTISGFAQNKQSTLKFRFATRAEAQMLVTDIDNFSNGLNQFDIDIRLQKENSRKSEWLRLAMNEAKNWSEAEKDKVTKAFKTIKSNIKKMNLKFTYPDEIVLLKTTMKEELNAAAYTRKNWIAIGEDFINTASNEQLIFLVGHELFHLLSRKSIDFKRSAYQIIGYTVTDHEIILPTDIIAKRISNPDIERRDSYVELDIEGKTTKCVQILYATKPYTTGSIDQYMSVGFIPLNEDLIPIMANGQTIIYPVSKVSEQLHQKVGHNTNYMIDPEEILADNFAFMLNYKKNLANPEIVQALKAAFSAKK